MTEQNPITQSIDWLVECGWSKEQWDEAHRKTIGWLFENNLLKL